MDTILAEPTPIGATSRPVYPLRVEFEDVHHWQRALTRGQEQRLTAERRNSTDICGIVMTGYAVSSSSQPGISYGVAVSRDWEGDVYTICECEAGLLGIPCTHAAVALQAEQLWPFPVFSQTPMGLP